MTRYVTYRLIENQLGSCHINLLLKAVKLEDFFIVVVSSTSSFLCFLLFPPVLYCFSRRFLEGRKTKVKHSFLLFFVCTHFLCFLFHFNVSHFVLFWFFYCKEWKSVKVYRSLKVVCDMFSHDDEFIIVFALLWRQSE